MEMMITILLLFSILVLVAILVMIILDSRMSIVQEVDDNFDGSYTVTVSVKNPNKMRKYPLRVKMDITEGKALFIRNPNQMLDDQHLSNVLFIVVVNKSTIIELQFGKKITIINGEHIANHRQLCS